MYLFVDTDATGGVLRELVMKRAIIANFGFLERIRNVCQKLL